MNWNYRLLASGLALVALAAIPGCKKDDPVLGGRGESCRSRVDCADGLVCTDKVCSEASFKLTATGKECVTLQCRTSEECCPTCANLKAQCDAGVTSFCDQYTAALKKWSCSDNKCENVCTTNSDCSSYHCAGGRCVDCVEDDDCKGASQCNGSDCFCIKSLCQPKCSADRDCGALQACQSGACVHVGCSTDRECVAYTRDARALCKDKACQVPCATDSECDSPYSYDFMSCVKGNCTSIGCESNDECRVRANSGGVTTSPTSLPTSLPTAMPTSTISTGTGKPVDAECRTQVIPSN